MNPNHASLEASKRLREAGVVLETEFAWGCQVNRDGSKEWKIQFSDCHFINDEPEYPAPSMAEVWRELPWYIEDHGSLEVTKEPNSIKCGYHKGLAIREPLFVSYDNPTDALIDLLIWVRGRKEKWI